MAEYRTGDYSGARATIDEAALLRGGTSPVESAFKAMALYRLGRASEGFAILNGLRAQAPSSIFGDLKGVMAELEAMSQEPQVRTAKPS
jgi:hypothetical protein